MGSERRTAHRGPAAQVRAAGGSGRGGRGGRAGSREGRRGRTGRGILRGRHPRGGNRAQQPGQQVLDGQPLGQRLVARHQAVAQDVGGDVVDVLGQGVVAAPQQREGAGGGDQAEAGAGAGPEGQQLLELGQLELGGVAGGQHQAHGVLDHAVVDVDLVGQVLQRQQVGQAEHLDGVRRVHAHPVDDLDLFGRARVADHDLHEEPVALGLGQGVDAFALDRVLRGEHQERRRHVEGLAADGHVVLGHHLEQRRLHLGRGPVDLVGQHEVGEDRAELDVEALARRAVDARAGDVGRQQVGGELQAGVAATDDGGQRLGGQGLGQAGNALEQGVAAGEQADDETFDGAVLPDDDLLHLEEGLLEAGGGHRRRGEKVGIGHRRSS